MSWIIFVFGFMMGFTASVGLAVVAVTWWGQDTDRERII